MKRFSVKSYGSLLLMLALVLFAILHRASQRPNYVERAVSLVAKGTNPDRGNSTVQQYSTVQQSDKPESSVVRRTNKVYRGKPAEMAAQFLRENHRRLGL